MKQLLKHLFARLSSLASRPAPSRGGRQARLSLEGMEERLAPSATALPAPAALINPATIRSFNPQPEPPGKDLLIIHGFNPQPEPPGVNAGVVNGIVIVGGSR